MLESTHPIPLSARELQRRLLHGKHRVVFAESCTAGMAAALLGAVPGISVSFCGPFVVYRAKSKQNWLGLPEALLSDPTRGTVCAETTQLLCEAALQKTEEANLSAAVTGHLGPGVASELDGIVYVAVSFRGAPAKSICRKYRLASPPCKDVHDVETRERRQR